MGLYNYLLERFIFVKLKDNNMYQKIDKNLEDALEKLEEDYVRVEIEQPTPDNYIIIRTKRYELRMGANELGFWLEYIKERESIETKE